jgi:hypothetical protein
MEIITLHHSLCLFFFFFFFCPAARMTSIRLAFQITPQTCGAQKQYTDSHTTLSPHAARKTNEHPIHHSVTSPLSSPPPADPDPGAAAADQRRDAAMR